MSGIGFSLTLKTNGDHHEELSKLTSCLGEIGANSPVEALVFDPRTVCVSGSLPANNPGVLRALASAIEKKGFIVSHDVLRVDLDGLRCGGCIDKIESALLALPYIRDCFVNLANKKGEIWYFSGMGSPAQALETISRLGFAARIEGDSEPVVERWIPEEARLAFILIGGTPFALEMGGMMVGFHPHWPPFLQWLGATMVLLAAGGPFFQGAWRALRGGYSNMDTLVSLGSLTAYLFGSFQWMVGGPPPYSFEAAAMIPAFVSLGKFLEERALLKGRLAILDLKDHLPAKARVIRGEREISLSPDLVEIGERLRLLPGEEVPLDAMVIEGESEVTESAVNGEPLPRLVSVGDRLFAGSVNLNGSLIIEVLKGPGESLIGSIVKLMERAQAEKSEWQRFADRIAGRFTPFVLFLAILCALYWLWWGLPSAALLNAISLLVVACPCALGLATPLAVVNGLGVALKKGIFFKNGGAFEKLASIQGLLMDKTGTLTTGRFVISEIRCFGNRSDRVLSAIAAALEKNSEHPLASAFRGKGLEDGLQEHQVQKFEAVRGRGVIGEIQGDLFHLGNLDFLRERFPQGHFNNPFSPIPGEIAIHLAENGKLVASFRLADGLRPHARETIHHLRGMGIKVALLSGDRMETVTALAKDLGIDHAFGGCLPEDKAKFTREWRAMVGRVGMVGDGINDCVALAEADASLSFASELALNRNAADIILAREELNLLPESIFLARGVQRKIRQNLFWAFFYNLICLPLAFFGKLTPTLSAMAMSISSLCVVLNSLALGWDFGEEGKKVASKSPQL